MKTMLKETVEYARFVGRRFVEDRCLMVAGSLTYTSLLALVPVFAVTIALTAQVPLVRDFILEIRAFILKNLLPDVGDHRFKCSTAYSMLPEVPGSMICPATRTLKMSPNP